MLCPVDVTATQYFHHPCILASLQDAISMLASHACCKPCIPYVHTSATTEARLPCTLQKIRDAVLMRGRPPAVLVRLLNSFKSTGGQYDHSATTGACTHKKRKKEKVVLLLLQHRSRVHTPTRRACVHSSHGLLPTTAHKNTSSLAESAIAPMFSTPTSRKDMSTASTGLDQPAKGHSSSGRPMRM